jgi:hypothetical protein
MTIPRFRPGYVERGSEVVPKMELDAATGGYVCARDYDALAARLAEAERVLQVIRENRHGTYNGTAALMMVQAADSAVVCTCFGNFAKDLDCPIHAETVNEVTK